MGKIFSFEMNHLKKAGYLVAVHTPAVLNSYFSFGHLPVADAIYLSCSVIPLQKKTENIHILNKNRWKELYPLYKKFAEKYSGIIRRTEEDFLRKAADYAADGGKTVAYIENNNIKAYAFYYQTETEMLCVEAVAEEGYWENLIEGLFSLGAGLKFSAKLPPEIELSYSFAKLERKQKGVMGLCNVSGLLKALELDIPYCFKLNDPVVPDNNGVFDFKGNITSETPVFELSAGHLLQVLTGYYSLIELKNDLHVFDEEKLKEINNLLPKQNCYIIDEY